MTDPLLLLALASGVLVVFFVLVASMKYPAFMLAVLIAYISVQDTTLYLARSSSGAISSIGSALDLFDELILVCLTASWVLAMLVQHRRFRRTPLDALVLVFLIYYVFSGVINSVHPLNLLFGIRDVFPYLLLFYALTQLDLPHDVFLQLFRLTLVVAFAHFAVLLAQWALFYARTGSLAIEDFGVGLMGPFGAHKLGYFAGALLMAYLGFYRERVFTNVLVPVALMLMVAISSTRAAMLYLPVVITLLFFRRIIGSRRILIAWFGALLVFVGVVFVYRVAYEGGTTLNPAFLYRQQMRTQIGDRYTRIENMRYTWRLLEDEGATLTGVGPGWYISKTASRFGSPYFERIPEELSPPLTQIAITLGEYGVVGSLLIVAFYLRMLLMAVRITSKPHSQLLRGFAAATIGSTLFCGLATVSNNVFELQQVIVIPWLVAGSTVALYRFEKRRHRTAAASLGSAPSLRRSPVGVSS